MRNKIILEVKNGAYEAMSVCVKICRILEPYTKTCICVDLAEIPLENYYMPDGRKITKPIKKLLLKYVCEETVDKHYAAICKQIAELYSPKYSLEAYWGDKSLLGKGEYEGTPTCFRFGGENEVSRKFIEKYKRTKCLILKRVDTTDTARCIVYFAGGRNIYLTNFYYKRITQNYRLFVEALRMLLGLKKVSFKDCNNPELPIYLNDDGILVHDEKSFKYPFTRKFPCPHCDDIVDEKKMLHEVEGTTHYIGCCDSCLGFNTAYAICSHCDTAIFDEADAYYIEADDRTFCYRCYERYVQTCANCGHKSSNENFEITNNDETLCEDCYSTCEECGDVFRNNEINDNGLCSDCQADEDEQEEEEEKKNANTDDEDAISITQIKLTGIFEE